MSYYYEQVTFHGAWTPCKVSEEPRVKKGRICHGETLGARVRGAKQIPKCLEGATLEELQSLLAPERDNG